MIREAPITLRPLNRTTDPETLAEEIRSLCVSAGILDSHVLREFSKGVAWRAADLPCRPHSDSVLPRLTAQALGSLGRPDAAQRVLMLGSGLVQTSHWHCSRPSALWTLDLEKLMRKEGDRLELALFRGLDIILESLASLWDATSGSGDLGLRRAAAAAVLILGENAASEAVLALRRDMRAFCEARLRATAERRCWTTQPRILFLEPEPI